MPRAHRHVLAGRTYHVTQRCHDRAFLLKFARDRQAWRAWLRAGLEQQPVRLLTYCATSNHVHLLLRAAGTEALAGMMQHVAGGVAQAYNQRKRRTGAFWADRYHATMIEDGAHLWRCLRYIDLNMVRAGVVRHPREWEWTGWGELMGERKRNRLIDLETVLLATGAQELESFRQAHAGSIEAALKDGDLRREPWWSEAVAVGSPGYVAEVEQELTHSLTRRRLKTDALESSTAVLHEDRAPYGAFSGAENRSIGQF